MTIYSLDVLLFLFGNCKLSITKETLWNKAGLLNYKAGDMCQVIKWKKNCYHPSADLSKHYDIPSLTSQGQILSCLKRRRLKVKVLVTQSCSTLRDSMDCSQPGSSPRKSSGKNTGVGCHSILQRVFMTQGSNLSLRTASRFFTTWVMKIWCLLHGWGRRQSFPPLNPKFSFDYKNVAPLNPGAEPPFPSTSITQKFPILRNLLAAYHFSFCWISSSETQRTWASVRSQTR